MLPWTSLLILTNRCRFLISLSLSLSLFHGLSFMRASFTFLSFSLLSLNFYFNFSRTGLAFFKIYFGLVLSLCALVPGLRRRSESRVDRVAVAANDGAVINFR